MNDDFIITQEDINDYSDAVYKILERSPDKCAIIGYEVGKFILSYENDNYKNGKLIKGREPTRSQIPGFIKTLIGKDISGDLEEVRKEMANL